MPENKIPNALENNSFAVSFMHLKLRGEHKEDYMEVGKSKVGLGYKVADKIMLSWEWLWLISDAQKQWIWFV